MSNILAGRGKVIIAFLLVFGPAFLLILISTRGCSHKFKELSNYGVIKDVEITLHPQSRKVRLSEFKGDILLITTLQKTCPTDCAVSFWHIDQMHFQHIRKNKNKKLKRVRIISFVTDGKGNPASVEDVKTLSQALYDNVEEYDPEIWILATGDVKAVYNIQHNDQTLLQKGNKFYGGEAFQELILLLDKERNLRMVLPGNEEGLVRKMREHVALLQKQYDKERGRKNN
ncbi:MAG: hypothetical protein RL264_934 [Bacteroidota bacterium]|jgi:hypothetical protein